MPIRQSLVGPDKRKRDLNKLARRSIRLMISEINMDIKEFSNDGGKAEQDLYEHRKMLEEFLEHDGLLTFATV